ncbi:thioredoxin family protein [Flavisolibacter nicotianae]|uniref:thioredoxin family protein n=1 Tax=Flavisolibacter nicotianae TaxID=2364882 RepID=UPI000EB3A5EC|nr:thioredoxin family protein [Flavisolibacter nicotianae]
MKTILLCIIAFFSLSSVYAQPAVEISRDNSGIKVLKGFISRKDLVTDTAFSWFAEGQKSFTPNPDVVKQFAAVKDSVSILIFGGTWCGDTKHLLPNFLATTDAAGLSPNRITLLGVDRNKKTLFNLAETFNIINVPTFIVLKNGKEIGRVVEYGRIGMPEKELAEVIAGSASNKQ